MSVSIKPGAMALQRTLRLPSSAAIDLVKPMIPAFAAAYADCENVLRAVLGAAEIRAKLTKETP